MAALASLLQANNEESSNGAEYGSYSDANATDTEAILSTILHMNKGKPHVSASDQSSLFNHYFSIAMRQQQQGLDILNNLGESGGLNVSVSATVSLLANVNVRRTEQILAWYGSFIKST